MQKTGFLFFLTLANLATYVEASNGNTTDVFVDKAILLCYTGIVVTNLWKSNNTRKRKCADINNLTENNVDLINVIIVRKMLGMLA